MYESTEGQALGRPSAHAVESSVDAAFVALLDELFTGPRVTYPPVGERPVHYEGDGRHRSSQRRHRRFVLRAGADLDDPY